MTKNKNATVCMTFLAVLMILCAALTGCGGEKAQAPFDYMDCRGMDYADVLAQLQTAGFTQVTTEVVGTTDKDWDGEVVSVVIDDMEMYNTANKWVSDVLVVVKYYVLERFTVTMAITPGGKPESPMFTIETNLPDKTKLTVTLTDGGSYKKQQTVKVKDGVATTDRFFGDYHDLEGDYTLTCTMRMDEQGYWVKVKLGSQGDCLDGSLVKIDEETGEQYLYLEQIYTAEDSCDSLQELFLMVDAEITVDSIKAFCKENNLSVIRGQINEYIIVHSADESLDIHRFGTGGARCDYLRIWAGYNYPEKVLKCEYSEHLNGMSAWWYAYKYDISFNLGGEYIGYYLVNPNTMNRGIINEHGNFTKFEPRSNAQEIIDEMNNFDYQEANKELNPVEDLFINITEDMTREQIEQMAEERNLFFNYMSWLDTLEIAPVQSYNTTLKGRMVADDCFGIIVHFESDEADSKISSVDFINPVQGNVYQLTGTYYVRVRNAAYEGTYDTDGYGYYIHNPEIEGIVIINVDGSKTNTNLLQMENAEELVRYIKEYGR